RYYLELNRRLRAVTPAFSAFGGPHATFFPEMIEEDDLVDGLCIGEGEEALVELADALQAGTWRPDVLNWHFRVNGEIVRNPVRPYVADLDALPLPDRALVYDVDAATRGSKLKHFITSRGCPYDCTYCFNHALADIYRGKGRRVRQRSLDSVFAEINATRAEYPLEFVGFLDDTFILFREWIDEFARRYPREIGLPFFCNVRANLVDQWIVDRLKAAGCASVGMGIETGDDRLRNEILKRNLTKEQVISSCQMFRQAGIQVITTNMVGLPTGGIREDWETVELNARCRPGYANAYIFQPYPRTQLGELARQNDLLEGDIDDIGLSAWDHSILKFPPDEKRQIENLQRLFGLAVEWPWLIPLVRWMVKWPRNPLFWWAYKLWKGYTIKTRIHPVKLSPREAITIVIRFLKLE
ncbi:MAG: radical SAM protein, partial [Chloroflexi bacterium]|nr:radical SAM protein [Chloroflexota bacterium]